MPKLIHYNVLFTGGLDSTYRLCQLAIDKNAVVHPIYIVFPDDGKSLHVRPEFQRELEAQDKILEYLINHPNTKAKILPIKRIYRDEIPKDQRIMDLEGYLVENGLGWQYLYFACLSVWFSNLELCHEDYMSRVLYNKYKYKICDGIRILDSNGIDERFYLLFKNFSWPIFGVKRKQMFFTLDVWGFKDIKNLVFFCYKTINGEPCGICDNCRAKIKQGLKFLFTNESIHRYLLYYYVKTHFGGNYFKYFSLYMRHNNKHLVFSFDKDILFFFKSIDKVNALDNHTLKNVIINGSLKYGFSDYKKEQILSYRYRPNRKKLFDYLD